MASLNTYTPDAAQAPAANTAAVATVPSPPSGQRWYLRSIRVSYSATPTGGKITLAWGAYEEVYHISSAGLTVIPWQNFRPFASGETFTVTLAAGGNGVLGTVYLDATTGY